MRPWVRLSSLLALALALSYVGAGCKDKTSSGPAVRSACEGLSYCDCRARPGCRPLSKGCLCPCEHKCPGFESCKCVCGGGKYLGCAKAKPMAKAKAAPKRKP